MKRRFIPFLLIVLFVVSILSSCGVSNPSESPSIDESKTNSNVSNVDKNNESKLLLETPPDDYMYSFDSYLALKNALLQKETKEYATLRAEHEKYGKVYQQTLSAFSSGNAKLAVPQIGGTDAALRNDEGFSNITLLTCELYNMPWIWYHCAVNGGELDIKMSYLTSLTDVTFSPSASYEDVLKIIAPGAPSPDNYKKFPSYQSIYRRDLTLSDGVKVSAIVMDVNDSENMYVMFRYGDILVSVHGSEAVLSDDLWAGLSFRFEFEKVTEENFKKLKVGMTYNEVISIIGPFHFDYCSSIYPFYLTWEAENGDRIDIGFLVDGFKVEKELNEATPDMHPLERLQWVRANAKVSFISRY